MSQSRQFGVVSRWHRRVLGFVWALGGLLCIWDVHRTYWWEQGQAWLPVLIGTPYLIVGISFARRRVWADVAMGILAAVGALIFAYCIFMAGWVGNRPLLHWMLAAFGFAAYTAGFILVSFMAR